MERHAKKERKGRWAGRERQTEETMTAATCTRMRFLGGIPEEIEPATSGAHTRKRFLKESGERQYHAHTHTRAHTCTHTRPRMHEDARTRSTHTQAQALTHLHTHTHSYVPRPVKRVCTSTGHSARCAAALVLHFPLLLLFFSSRVSPGGHGDAARGNAIYVTRSVCA